MFSLLAVWQRRWRVRRIGKELEVRGKQFYLHGQFDNVLEREPRSHGILHEKYFNIFYISQNRCSILLFFFFNSHKCIAPCLICKIQINLLIFVWTCVWLLARTDILIDILSWTNLCKLAARFQIKTNFESWKTYLERTFFMF